MSKINKILLAVVIILLILVIILGVLWYLSYGQAQRYHAVYLDTGDIYFGKLKYFPSLTLSDVWYLSRDAQGNNMSVVEFAKAAWQPEGDIRISKNKVVWITKLSRDSVLIPILSGQQVTQPQPTPTATPTE